MPDQDWVPPDGHPVTRRKSSGTYDTPLGTFRSVTTILNQLAKDGLPHWYARTVAECAISHLPYLSRLRGRPAREAAFSWLRLAAERKKNEAGDLGSEVHHHAEARILGTPMPEPTELAVPILQAFDNFLDDWLPSFEATELIVANPEIGFAGTCDAFLRLRPLGFTMLIIDYKTGKGVWGEAAMQVCAYNHATHAWLPNGIEVEPPTAERGLVVHLRPDAVDSKGEPRYPRGYGLLPVDIGEETWQQFLAAKRLDDGRLFRSRAVGEPLVLPPPPELPDLSDLPKVS